MSRQDFVDQLTALGYGTEVRDTNRVIFTYQVPVGTFEGQEVRLGFEVQDDFPLNPPGGPHVSPRLLPIHPGNELPHPLGAVHESPLGADWEYWSRPFSDWPKTDRSVKAYLKHIYRLFATQ